MATLKLDIPGLSGGSDDPQQQQAAAPPPPPPPPPNFAAFASNPLAQQKVSAMIPGLAPPPPPQVALAPQPPSQPHGIQGALQGAAGILRGGLNAPRPQNIQPPPLPQVASAGAPPSAPGVAQQPQTAPGMAPMQSFPDWQQQNPGMQEQKLTGLQKALQIAAGIVGGGVPGGVGAGQAIHQHDLPSGLQGIDQGRYQQAVVQPYTAQLGALDTASQIQQRQGAANASNARANAVPGQLQAKRNTITAQLAAKGQTGTFDDDGNLTGVADDPNSAYTKKQQAQTQYFQSRQELQDAQAELAKSKNNPNSPAFRQAQQRVNIAAKNAQTAAERLGLSTQEFGFNQEKFFNPQPTATERGKGDLAQSALERVQEMKAIVAKRPDIFGPVQGRAQNAQVWLGSQDPDAQTYQSAAAYLAEHSAGVFGGRGKYILESLHGLTDPHSNPAALSASLDEAERAAQGFATAGQVHHTAVGPPGAAAPPSQNGGYTNLHRNPKTGQTIGIKGGKWYDTKTNQAVQ
jgi:hypothetical protein